MLTLSPSSLGDFKKCPRCYWLDKRLGLKLPRGAFPSLPGGMDRKLKEHYDRHRAMAVLPPELDGLLPAGTRLFEDQAKLKRWRYWKTGLVAKVSEEVSVSGAFDDLLVLPDGKIGVLDYKTRGAAPVEGESETYYGHQLDAYALMLGVNGYKPDAVARLIYYYPEAAVIGDKKASWLAFGFHVAMVEVTVKTERAIELALGAAKCLSGDMPRPGDNCEVCPFIDARAEGVISALKSEPVGAVQEQTPGGIGE